MNTDAFYDNFKQSLFKKYPSTKTLKSDLDLTHLVSPYVIQLDRSVLDRVQKFVSSIFQISRTDAYAQVIQTDEAEIQSFDQKNLSVLMAYDFHIMPEREALIEINTNAAMYLVSEVLNSCQGIQYMPSAPAMDLLKASFIREFVLFTGQPAASPRKVVITDEQLASQKRYVEFLMYKDLFSNWGWNPEIIEFQDLKIDSAQKALVTPSGEKIDLLYNRYCDFYLSQPESATLRQAYLEKLCCFTPNPKEYLLLADKGRMIELGSESAQADLGIEDDQWSPIAKSVLTTRETASYPNPETLWAQRKKLFFKPKNQFGGKSAYRGEGLTTSVFERALKENFLTQEFVPAPEPTFTDSSVPTKGWKYDLRFYVYGDQIQNIIARLYKGQVTNFTQPLGGFASVKFV